MSFFSGMVFCMLMSLGIVSKVLSADSTVKLLTLKVQDHVMHPLLVRWKLLHPHLLQLDKFIE